MKIVPVQHMRARRLSWREKMEESFLQEARDHGATFRDGWAEEKFIRYKWSELKTFTVLILLGCALVAATWFINGFYVGLHETLTTILRLAGRG